MIILTNIPLAIQGQKTKPLISLALVNFQTFDYF